MRPGNWFTYERIEAVLVGLALLLPLGGSGCQCGGTGGRKDLSATIEATSPVVADGVRTSVVTITVLDGSGEPASAIELTLLTDRAADSVEQPASPTNAAGQATARVASTEVGSSSLSLTTVAGDAIGGSGTIEFIAGTLCSPGDSEPCYDGPAGTETEGLCQAGTRDCDGSGSWGACSGQVLPLLADDDCDGADSDCDGSTDEDVDVNSPATCGGCGVVCSFPNATALCDAATRGCSLGTCDPDWWPAADPADGCDYFCAGDSSADEICNGEDEDCDGVFDEGFDADNDGFTSCGTVAGGGTDPALVDCEDLLADVNPDGVETCDGRDEDCDGNTDGGLTAPGLCLALGVCTGTTEACGGISGWVCNYDPSYQAIEDSTACDNLDNDCDGLTDETCSCVPGDPPLPCSVDVGACVSGTQACLPNGTRDTCTGILPATETCDGTDESCDGTVDEGFDGDNDGYTSCGTDPAGGIDPARVDCDPTRSDVNPGATEICNGIDDDCDGLTDEGGDASCDDGTFCNGTESCGGVAGCQAGTAPTCDDGVSCTTDSCDATTDVCTNAADDTICDDGVFCSGIETCDAVNDCQPGNAPTCDDGVGCTTDTCEASTDACQNSTVDAACDDGTFCNGVETCDAALDCQAGIAPTCDDAVGCTTDTCEASTDACQNATVDAACDDSTFCNGVETCNAVTDCQAGTPPSCDDGVSCTTDSCEASTDACQNATVDAACDDGTFCNGAETCDAAAGCQAGTAPTCDDGVGCTTDTCEASTDACLSSAVDAACDDGTFCNGPETCDAALDCQAGTPPACDDGVGCTTDSCAASTDACQNTTFDAACDDGSFCTGVEVCNAVSDCQPGTPPVCDDGVGCTIDTCDGATDACAAAPDDTACSDGNSCTLDVCNAVAGCQFPDDDGTACSIGACSGVCGASLCGGCSCNVPADCDDGVACTLEDCVAGSCVNTPTDTACDDGTFCNGAETCDAVSDCQPGAAPACDDGVGCTTDSCNGATDACQNTTVDAACDDGTFCNGAEACDAALDCQPGPAPTCDDGVGCTTDSCSGATDACQNATVDAVCDDGTFCNGAETCDAVSDCQPGAAPACDDGVGCTTDSCDGVTDLCQNTTVDSACDDGTFCNGAESCDAILDCQTGTPPSCDDAVGCTTDVCDGPTDACQNTTVAAACDDGVFCNGTESCDSIADCQPGAPPACDDGVGCTTDNCSSATDACLNLGVDAACDDGTFCNGAETCDTVADCQAGTPPTCDDGVGCTTDSCDVPTDACANPGSDPACDDGTFCNGAETCNAVLDCQAGTIPTCDDGVFCTTDSCDLPTDTCASAGNDAACDDGTFCNGAETCDVVADCQAGTPAVCNDGDACTTDSCSVILDACDYPFVTVDAASTVTASSACLTLGSSARAAVFVDLRDTLGVPLAGATLTPQVTGEAVTWSTPFAESVALPGTYYGVFDVPTTGVSSTIAIDYGACTLTGTLAGTVTVTYAAANSGVGGTDGCNGPDGNLRVQVLAAEDDSVIEDAHVMVGLTGGTPLVTDPEVFLVGGAPNVTNLGLTDAQGYVTFHDLGTALDGPINVTAGQPDASSVDRAYFTYDRVSAADLVMPLAESDPTIPTVRLDAGTASGFSETNTTADLQGGLVLPQVTLGEVTALDLDSLLEPNRCVTLPAGQGVLAMPENLWVPQQCMARFFVCLGTLAEHEWAATVPQNNRLNMLVGGLDADVAQNMCEWSELLQGFSLGGSSNSAIGFVDSSGTGSSSSGTSIALANGAHVRTLALTTSNRPADTDIFAAVLGDHAGSDGLGPNYVNGFKFERYDASPGSTNILFASNGAANLPTIPDPATSRYWAAAIATYFDPTPSRPAANSPPATAGNGASTVLWRDDGTGNAPLDGSADATWSVSDFLAIAKVAVNGTNKTFTWDDVASSRSPNLSFHTLYRETETFRAAPLSCSSEKDVVSTRRATDWEVWRPYAVSCTGLTGNESTPGPKECFTLPTLPAGWPRASADPVGGKFDGMTQLVGGAEACAVVGDCGIAGDACELFGGRCTLQTHKSCTGDATCSDCRAGDTCGGSEQICVDTSSGLSRTQTAYWSLRIDALGSAAAFDFNAFELPERSAGMTHESSNYFPLNR